MTNGRGVDILYEMRCLSASVNQQITISISMPVRVNRIIVLNCQYIPVQNVRERLLNNGRIAVWCVT